MGRLLPLRRLRHGPPRKLPTPHVLRGRRPRLRRARYVLGFTATAVVASAALHVWLQPDGNRLLHQFGNSLQAFVSEPYTPVRITYGSGETQRTRVAHSRQAVVVDGDSLRIGRQRIRLDGIDAPELRQSCRTVHGGEWPCGRAARARLAQLVAGGNVACSGKGRDRYGRMLAVCSAGDVRDLGEVLVRAGLAVNYDRYTSRYRAVQDQARAARRGIWGGDFQQPEDWRRRKPPRDTVGRSR